MYKLVKSTRSTEKRKIASNDRIRRIYEEKKKNVEKYQRNIFGFSLDINITPNECFISVILFIIIMGMGIGYMINKVIQIESQKFDIWRSTSTTQSFGSIGKVNVLRDANLMPIISFKLNEFKNIENLGIFKQ